MRFAIVGTGFVVDYYMTTLVNHAQLELAGAWDKNKARLTQFCNYYKVPPYENLEALLADKSVECVVVLTTPESHFELCQAALEAGKHVYCEKPLAMEFGHAQQLAQLARSKNLCLGGAPANTLSPAFSATKKALASGEFGAPKLVYAEMEDGPVFREKWQSWRSKSGAPWPGKHEFEIGCTLEHAGYAMSWLTGLFGTVKTISGASGTFFFDKGADIPSEKMGPDFTTACLTFSSGVVVRLTCGLCAPKDRALTIMGEKGTLTVADLWDNNSIIHLERAGEKPGIAFRFIRRLEAKLGRVLPVHLPAGQRLSYRVDRKIRTPNFPSKIDFCAGIAAMAETIGDSDGELDMIGHALHGTEAVLALAFISDHNGFYTMTSKL